LGAELGYESLRIKRNGTERVADIKSYLVDGYIKLIGNSMIPKPLMVNYSIRNPRRRQ